MSLDALKKLAEAAKNAKPTRNSDEYYLYFEAWKAYENAMSPDVCLELIAEIESLRQAYSELERHP